jgi:hypothetical protein
LLCHFTCRILTQYFASLNRNHLQKQGNPHWNRYLFTSSDYIDGPALYSIYYPPAATILMAPSCPTICSLSLCSRGNFLLSSAALFSFCSTNYIGQTNVYTTDRQIYTLQTNVTLVYTLRSFPESSSFRHIRIYLGSFHHQYKA